MPDKQTEKTKINKVARTIFLDLAMETIVVVVVVTFWYYANKNTISILFAISSAMLYAHIDCDRTLCMDTVVMSLFPYLHW